MFWPCRWSTPIKQNHPRSCKSSITWIIHLFVYLLCASICLRLENSMNKFNYSSGIRSQRVLLPMLVSLTIHQSTSLCLLHSTYALSTAFHTPPPSVATPLPPLCIMHHRPLYIATVPYSIPRCVCTQPLCLSAPHHTKTPDVNPSHPASIVTLALRTLPWHAYHLTPTSSLCATVDR